MNCPMCGHQTFELAGACPACGELSLSDWANGRRAYPFVSKGLSWACFAGVNLLASLAGEFVEVLRVWIWVGFGLGICGMEIAKIICCFEDVPAKSWVQRSLNADCLGLLLFAACVLGSIQQEIIGTLALLFILAGQLLFVRYLLSIAALIGRADLAKRIGILTFLGLVFAGMFINDQVKRCYPWKPANTFEVYSPTIYGSLLLILAWLLLRYLSQFRTAVRSAVLEIDPLILSPDANWSCNRIVINIHIKVIPAGHFSGSPEQLALLIEGRQIIGNDRFYPLKNILADNNAFRPVQNHSDGLAILHGLLLFFCEIHAILLSCIFAQLLMPGKTWRLGSSFPSPTIGRFFA